MNASTLSPRRAALTSVLALLVACALVAAPPAAADEYPAKPIRLIVPAAADSPTDTAMRLLAKQMQASLGQPVAIENKPGAGGADAIAAVARAAPDGYTLGVADMETAILGAAVDPKYPYQPMRDLAFVGMAGTTELIFVGRSGLPANSMAELIAYARANPGKVRYGSMGTGGQVYAAFELLKHIARVDFARVALKGDTAPLAELVAGRIDVDLVPTALALPEIKAGKIKALSTASMRASKFLPDLPTLAQAGVPYYAVADWHVVVAPAATPPPAVMRLNAALKSALHDPALAAKYGQLGMLASALAVGQTRDFVVGETGKWTKIVAPAEEHARKANPRPPNAQQPNARQPSTRTAPRS